MANNRELEQFRELLEKSKSLLPEKAFVSEDTSRRTIVGINIGGFFRHRGLYRLSETINGLGSKYTLVQDTANGEPLIRAAIIEDEVVVRTVGSKRLRMEKMAVDLMDGFLSCERYLSVKEV